jgi:hypothetical protein
LTLENPFLVLSILSGAGAAAVLVYSALRSKLRNVTRADLMEATQLDIEPRSNKWRPNVLDRITLLNRNLIQCPRCLTIDSANIRYCCKCGMQMQVHAHSEFPRNDTQATVTQYVTQDGLTRVVGLSMRVDPKTRIGVIVGVQNQEPQEQLQEA